jgi:hypothetical protein
MVASMFEQNATIKQEADKILYENRLLEMFSAFGKVHVSGSYALDLMTWRDLDIYLETDSISENEFFQLGSALCGTLAPLRMQFRNERLAKTPGLPYGLYWGVYLGDERAGAWKLDVWAVSSGECDRLVKYCATVREQLDDVSRAAILSIKSQCWQDPEYRKTYSSAHIYDAVLKGGVRDLQGFWDYLNL